jgi:hypothetical protein
VKRRRAWTYHCREIVGRRGRGGTFLDLAIPSQQLHFHGAAATVDLDLSIYPRTNCKLREQMRQNTIHEREAVTQRKG